MKLGLPSLDPFTPEPSPASRSPTQYPDMEEDQQVPTDGASQRLEDVLLPPVLDEPLAWLGDGDPGKSGTLPC